MMLPNCCSSRSFQPTGLILQPKCCPHFRCKLQDVTVLQGYLHPFNFSHCDPNLRRQPVIPQWTVQGMFVQPWPYKILLRSSFCQRCMKIICFLLFRLHEGVYFPFCWCQHKHRDVYTLIFDCYTTADSFLFFHQHLRNSTNILGVVRTFGTWISVQSTTDKIVKFVNLVQITVQNFSVQRQSKMPPGPYYPNRAPSI